LRTKAFLDGLRDLGHVEGKTIAIEWKWGQDRSRRCPSLPPSSREGNVDVIVTGGTAAAKTLKAATQQIPIGRGHHRRSGRSRPGGKSCTAKRQSHRLSASLRRNWAESVSSLLKEIVPNLSAVSVLLNARNPQSQIELKEMLNAAQQWGCSLPRLKFQPRWGWKMHLLQSTRRRAGARRSHRSDPVQSAETNRRSREQSWAAGDVLFQGFVEDGGLMSYGPSDADLFRRAAGYVDRILKAQNREICRSKQPTKFELFHQPQNRQHAWPPYSRVVFGTRR